MLGLLQINTALIAQIGTGYDYAPSYVNVTGGGAMPSTADGYVCDCDGTGTTDATACLQAALNTAASQNKPLLIPATSNYYLVNGTLMVNCSVIGINGMPTLRQTTTAEFTPVLRLVNNMTGWINNLHIIGSYSGSGDGTTEYNHLVNLGGVNGVTVSGNLLEKALGDCVTDNAQEQDANAARNVLVTGNTMLNPWRCNVSFNNVADRWAVMNNYMTYYTSYVNPVDLEPWRSVAYVTNVEVGYNDIQSPNPKWEDANHFYDAVVKVTAYFDNTPGGNVYIHHNYGDWGVPIFNETGYQGGPSTWFNVVSTNNAEGTEPPGTSGDTDVPSTPSGLASSAVGETSFTLSWSASSDNVGVTGYEVFSNGISVGTTSSTSLNISGLSCGSSYAMKVSARDAAGNSSAQSAAKSVTTLACSGNTSVITFEDRPTDETELTGTYAGVDWGTSGWATYQETGVSPATKVLEMYTNNTAEETKTFTIPSGKVLKSLKIGAFSNPSTKKIVLSSPGNTTRTWTDMTAELNTYTTNWTTAASVITVKITSSAGASFIVMDDITYETVADNTPPPIAQSTYYVATDGNNSNNGTSLSTPWRSINYAAQQVQAGDEVLIKGGTYKERVLLTTSGTAANKIVFRAADGETPVIDGANLSFSNNSRRGIFEINSARYIRVEGLSVINATGLGLNGCAILVNGPSASHITISNCYTENTPSSGIAAWGNTGASVYNGVTDLIIENSTVVGALDGGYQEHITIADGVEDYEVRYNVVRDGQVPNPVNFPIGIDSKIDVRNGKVYGNEVYNLQSSNGIYVDAWDDGAYNIEIYNNIVHDVEGTGIQIGGEQGGSAYSIDVFNNIVYNTGADGLKANGAVGDPATDPTIYDIFFTNNTVYDCRSSLWVQGGTGAINVRNNIFSKNDFNNGIYVYASNKANVTASHNLIDAYMGRSWNDPVMEEIRGTSAVEQAPQFVDAAAADFRLSSSSPAIDAGTATGAPATDFTGKNRPVGSGYDLGAYEFGASAPPPPTTSGTGLASAVFSNKTLSGSPVATGTDAQVNFDWKTGGKVSGLTDNFSVRWTGEVQPQYSQQYTFYTQADDGTRLWVNGQLLINDWTNHAVREESGKIALEAGKKYSIKLEYFENTGGAVCRLLWSSSSRSKQIIPQARLYPVAGSQPSATNYTVRARGVQGTEVMALQIGGQTVKSWTVSTSMQNYSYSGSQTGLVRVAITNDQGVNHDLRVDKLTVDGTTYQAEAQAVNTGVWQNGSCGGSNSEWLHCSGYIQFELGAANARQDDQIAKQSLGEEPLSQPLIYPNPSVGGNFSVRGITDVSRVQMYDLTGREVKLRAEKVGAHYQMQPQDEVPQGMYVIQLRRDDNQPKQFKLLVQ